MPTKERFSAAKSRGPGRMRLCRPQQDVAFPANRQFDDAFRCEVGELEHHLLVADRCIIDAQTAALDLTPRLAIRGDEAGLDETRQHADAGFEFGTRYIHRWKVFGDRAFLKSLPCGFGSRSSRISAVQKRGCGV